jgi:HEAT repeats
MYFRFTLFIALLPILAAPAHAGIIFGKKPSKPDPAQRVPELIKIVRSDGDENKRVEAVEELRQYDPTTFPEIIPALIDVLQNDRKASVRAGAAQTISKLRPVSQAAGDALEQALDKDNSMRVRISVRSALLQYHWAGYRQGKKEESAPLQAPVQTREPPLADPLPLPSPTPPRSTPPPPEPTPAPTPTPRPLPPMPTPAPSPAPPSANTPRPLPQGPPIEVPTPPPSAKPVSNKDSGPQLGGSE